MCMSVLPCVGHKTQRQPYYRISVHMLCYVKCSQLIRYQTQKGERNQTAWPLFSLLSHSRRHLCATHTEPFRFGSASQRKSYLKWWPMPCRRSVNVSSIGRSVSFFRCWSLISQRPENIHLQIDLKGRDRTNILSRNRISLQCVVETNFIVFECKKKS